MAGAVYLGLWTNWSRGSVFGPTLTTSALYGNLLIAFTAVYIGFVASRFWRVICLVLHRCYSSAGPRDAIYHQRQVLLRNSSSPESGLFVSLKMLWAYRHKGAILPVHLLPLILLSVACLAGFTIAGGFSSSISTAVGNEVLISGDNCGPIVVNITTETIATSLRYNAEKLSDAANYAQQCYNTPGTAACNKFVTERLPTVMNNSSSCPFQDRICQNQEATLRLDTGYIDSNNDLGLNTPRDQRFAYRLVLHCAPLKTDGYTSQVATQYGNWTRYHYGTTYTSSLGNPSKRDFLYEVESLDLQYPNKTRALAGLNFILQ